MDGLTCNGSNSPPPATVSASAPRSSMSLYDLQGIAPAVKEDLFIPPPAPFSSSQPQLLTQPPPSLHGTLEHKVSDNKYSQGTVVQWLVGRTLIRATPV